MLMVVMVSPSFDFGRGDDVDRLRALRLSSIDIMSRSSQRLIVAHVSPLLPFLEHAGP